MKGYLNLPPQRCRVYWGSHGCDRARGHEGPHRCSCADDPPEPGIVNAGAPPYYGPKTIFYGEDSPDAEYGAREWD